MAVNRKGSKVAANGDGPKPTRVRKERKFPALTFEEALVLPEAIQRHASGQKVRRLTLFEKLDQSPDNAEARRLITASGQYGLTKGGYQAEYLELTAEGKEATGEDVAPGRKLEVRCSLAIQNQAPFKFLYEKLKGNRMPAKEVMSDYLSEADVEEDERAECIDTFILNAKFLGLSRTIAGSERLIPIEQAIEEAPQSPTVASTSTAQTDSNTPVPPTPTSAVRESGSEAGEFATTCFYITPIGEENSEQRQHADFMMTFMIEPALKEFGLRVIRADQMSKPGMIGKQVIEHIPEVAAGYRRSFVP